MSIPNTPLPRRSQLFLHNLLPVRNTYEELIKEKLDIGKFSCTIAGIIKVLSLLFLLVSLALFLGVSDCSSTSNDWFKYLFIISLSLAILVQLSLYIVFIYGITVNNPDIWIKLDIIFNLLLAALVITFSVLSFTECSTTIKHLNELPGILGITGGISAAIGVASLFLLYRFVEDEVESSIPQINPEQFRKSMAV